MSAPDDNLVEAVAEALFAVDETETSYEGIARVVLSVPALRDALARDAQVREIITIPNARYWRRLMALHELYGTEAPPRPDLSDREAERVAHAAIDAVLHPEVASMLRDGEGVDNSDIMPGSEFDGPVVL